MRVPNSGTTTIDIAGTGTATFSGDSFGFFSKDIGGSYFVGMLDITTLTSIMHILDTSLYDGVSNHTQTCTGTVFGSSTTYTTTSLGDLTITGVSGTATFTAVVPEPSSFALFGLVGIGLVIAKVRRRTAKASA